MRIGIFFLCLFFCINVISCKKEDAVNKNKINITIGALLSLTGNWSTLGLTSQESMNLAINDINSYMAQIGSAYRFSSLVFDTKLDTILAQKAIKETLGKNIHCVIGPQSSAELGAIRTFANSNNILVVSQGSTAGSLAIADDALFRFCPGDAVEGKAMAQTIYNSGLRSLITLARNDVGNKGLQNSVGLSFTDLGGTVDLLPPYPNNSNDFSALLITVKNKIVQLTNSNGADKVGVYLASFDECTTIFELASLDPVFSSVRWFGGDGAVFSSALTSNPAAATFAVATGFFVPNFGLPQQVNPKLPAIAAAIKSKTGLDADAYALSVYDAMWVIAKSEAAFPTTNVNFSTLKSVL